MFETLFFMLIPYINSTEAMRSLIAEVQDLIANERAAAFSEMRESYAATQSDHDHCKHEIFVAVCLSNNEILDHLNDNKKINAIKVLRGIVGHNNASLYATKQAIEDNRVTALVNDRALNNLRTKLLEDPELADHNSNYQQTRECSE